MQTAQAVRLASLALAAAGCVAAGAVFVSSDGHASTRAAATRTARVTERDFSIAAPKRLRAGDVDLVVSNRGPDTHELLVARARSGSLPLRSDGLTVNEKLLGRRLVGTVEGRGPGSTEELRLHLAPGNYVLFCNMAGHYLGGMHTRLVVR